MVCPNCGKENKENNKYCIDCGYLLKKVKENNSTGLNILAIIMGLPSLLYLVYFFFIVFNMPQGNVKSLNIGYFIALNIGVLLFLSINCHNALSKVFLIIDIISIAIVLIIYMGMFLIILPLDCLGSTCTGCLSIDGGGPTYNGIFFGNDGSCNGMPDIPFTVYYGF